MKFDIQTKVQSDGTVLQTVDIRHDDLGPQRTTPARERILTQCFDTLEAQVAKALVSLGWTPPKDHPLATLAEQPTTETTVQ